MSLMKKSKENWYCSKIGSHIVSRSKEGLLIRGIAECLIFQVEAKNRMEASNKSHEIIEESCINLFTNDLSQCCKVEIYAIKNTQNKGFFCSNCKKPVYSTIDKKYWEKLNEKL